MNKVIAVAVAVVVIIVLAIVFCMKKAWLVVSKVEGAKKHTVTWNGPSFRSPITKKEGEKAVTA